MRTKGKIEEQLKPCPFCGGKAEIKTGAKMVLVQCKGDVVNHNMLHSISTVWFYKKYKAGAIAAWNKRADDGLVGELKKACEAAIDLIDTSSKDRLG